MRGLGLLFFGPGSGRSGVALVLVHGRDWFLLLVRGDSQTAGVWLLLFEFVRLGCGINARCGSLMIPKRCKYTRRPCIFGFSRAFLVPLGQARKRVIAVKARAIKSLTM